MSVVLAAPIVADTALFRIDRFIVPAAALAAFSARVHRIDRMVRELPGCKRNLVLTQALENGNVRVLTLVEWADEATLHHAKAQIQQRYAAEGFDPQAFMNELGVEAEFGTYRNA
ncbi:hypothetical protein SAMN02745857_03710 [Andreprevotia lacus DSM 23236]|jgi:hypothetical protein|uniref:Antibiotic biosynthesis monooxygenase n=1 Tax=Andreprevotia lacus DSM 23236 TaxID=1121001 RepID=A0A1W1XZE6_9NEIS|nr:hypothetical protein [Andreprevotia lacus]SMC29237.1 hypothetical protein SAMN02745857_03710 [Andreprevotia lacus DSM 23236]